MLPSHPLIADVCGTIVHDDTTKGLIRHHFIHGAGSGNQLSKILVQLLSTSLVSWVFIVIETITGKQVYKSFLIACLRGEKITEINRSASDYADKLLQYRRCAIVTPVIDQAADSGQLVLASASLQPIVSALAQRLNATYVASKIGESDGFCTGRLVVDITGEKALALAELNGAPLEMKHYDMISDNLSDLSMLRRANNAMVVLRSPSHRQRWHDLGSVQFIEIYI